MKTLLFINLLWMSVLTIPAGTGQNLIHQSKKEIYIYLDEHGVQKSAIESGKREEDNMLWLAYSDKAIKVIYFFDTASVCNYYRRVYPISFYDVTLLFLNNNFETFGEATWKEKTDKESFMIKLRAEDKYFTLDEYQSIQK